MPPQGNPPDLWLESPPHSCLEDMVFEEELRAESTLTWRSIYTPLASDLGTRNPSHTPRGQRSRSHTPSLNDSSPNTPRDAPGHESHRTRTVETPVRSGTATLPLTGIWDWTNRLSTKGHIARAGILIGPLPSACPGGTIQSLEPSGDTVTPIPFPEDCPGQIAEIQDSETVSSHENPAQRNYAHAFGTTDVRSPASPTWEDRAAQAESRSVHPLVRQLLLRTFPQGTTPAKFWILSIILARGLWMTM